MSPEAEQPEAQETSGSAPAPAVAPSVAAPKSVARRPAGVPVWRTGKPDAFLAAAVETARTALEGITAASSIGSHLAAKSEGDRLVTHLFESKLAGYVGWQWYAVLTRNSRSKVVTVSELGLLPSEDSILAPEWVPWAERVRPEDGQQLDEESQETDDAPQEGDAAGGDLGDADAGSITGSDAADADYTDAAAVPPPSSADDGGTDQGADVP
ncbi:DUF3027 domain-containing protein [Pseudarthrobacter sp. NamE2]|uniref:DUF3027 domain-containing protein n=1 Tax=Pseudarthrobacter sp. NamE2 TaxID=2576838 RepID=UPI0010FE7475|nr:DUF3027 domain-containing protein [Pseudarthrobacter sp. NamE2]TLM81457.1 DUF3027 domain-containing protein [Pseudarthrobacter sp. NamE2]